MNYTNLTDEMLLRQIAQHDGDALMILYDRHVQAVYNLIRRIVRENGTADDLLQETFWQVWRKADDFRGEGKAIAWLFRIARNKSLDHLRRKKARPQPFRSDTQQTEEALWELLTTEHEVEHLAERALHQHHLRQALAKIPEDQRRCLELAFFEGMNQRQIATYMNIPLGTVKSRIRLALSKLQRLLRSVGYKAEDIKL